MSPRQRYLRDPMFATLVDTIRIHIENTTYTPTELREAVMLASIMYYENKKSICLVGDKAVWDWITKNEEDL